MKNRTLLLGAIKMREKVSSKLFISLFVIYTVHIIGKTSFSAATVGLVDEAILTKTQAGLISGAYWLLYAVGQFAGGFVVNKISPYLLINLSIVTSAVANISLAFTENYLIMFVIWGLSGLLQFGLWPAILKLLSTEIVAKQRSSAMFRISFCYCIGSIMSYILTAAVLAKWSWRLIFILCGVVGACSILFALYAEHRLSPLLREEEESREIAKREKGQLTSELVYRSGLILFCVLMVIKAVADSGIKSWMPTIMMETYGASPSYTSLLSVVLLVTNMLGVLITAFIYEKTKSDELTTLRVLYVAIIPMMLLLLNLKHLNVLIVTILMSGITILVYGSGQILTLNYPGRFHKWGLTATVGGIINCFAAIGNVIASYGGGFIADHFGWNTMIVVWNLLIIVFVILTIYMIPTWKKFRWKH